MRRWEAVTAAHDLDAHERWRLKLGFEQRANRHREWGLELQRAEAQDLISVVLHPLSEKDPAPWRGGSNSDDIRWRRGKVKSMHKNRKTARDEIDYFEREWTQLHQSDADDEQLIKSFVHKVARHFTPRDCPSAWRIFLKDIIYTAVTKEVFPDTRRELRQKMLQTSSDYVAELCQAQMLWRLALQPPKNSLFPPSDLAIETWPEFQMDDDNDDLEDVIPEEEAQDFQRSREEKRETYESSVTLHYYPRSANIQTNPQNIQTYSQTHKGHNEILTHKNTYTPLSPLISYIASHTIFVYPYHICLSVFLQCSFFGC